MQSGRLCTPPPPQVYLYDHSDFLSAARTCRNKNNYYNNLGTEHLWYNEKTLRHLEVQLSNLHKFVFTSSNGCPFRHLNLLELLVSIAIQYVEHFCWHVNPTLMAKMEFWIILTLDPFCVIELI
jgi:hypothetical protein